MKKVMLTLVAALSMTVALAQEPGLQRPKHYTTEQIVDKLNLDKKTAAKFSKLRSKYADLFKAPGKPGEKGERPSKEDMDKRMAQHKKYLNELKSILNDSQYSAYEKLEPQRGPGNKKK